MLKIDFIFIKIVIWRMDMHEIGMITFGKTIVKKNWTINDAIRADKLYFVCSGYAFCDNVRMTPGHIYIIDGKKSRQWKLGENFEHIYFDFTISPELKTENIVEISVREHSEIRVLIEAYAIMLNSIKCKKETENIGNAMLYTLLCLCDMVVPLFARPSNRITDVIKAISDSETVLTIDELAAMACLDKYYFIKLFKKETGTTPRRLINSIRLANAFSMLKNGDDIIAVAYKCGYSSQAAFTNAFKKKFGITPTQIKRI